MNIPIDLKKDIENSPLIQNQRVRRQVHTHHCSSASDPCLRRLYYRIKAWDKAKQIDPELAGKFRTGYDIEALTRRNIVDIGMYASPRWRLVGGDRPEKDKLFDDFRISGTSDGFLQIEQPDGKWETVSVCDIKSMSPYIFPNLNTVEDLKKYSWTRKYIIQLMLYALANNIMTCTILAVNKTNLYNMKFIHFDVDLGYCDKILARIKDVNEHLDAAMPPDKLNDPDECEECQFAHICCPEYQTGTELVVKEDEELNGVLERLDELAATIKEINELEKMRDNLLIQGQNIVCGTHMIMWKEIDVSYKAKAAYTAKQWRKKITKIEQKTA